MLRALLYLGACLAVSVLDGAPVYAQSSLGGATGCSALFALRDSPRLGVQDNAGFFDVAAIVKAREAIQQFRHDYHRDLFIETFAQVPAADRKRVNSWWRSQTEQYFSDWATRRAKAIGVDGVYVLICEKPRHVHVLVYPKVPDEAFGDDNAQNLRKRLEHRLPNSHDAALTDAVSFVRSTVQENLAARESASTSIHFQTIAAIIGGAVGFWLLLSLMRAILSRRDANNDSAHVGLLPGFFGALFGTTAGHWMYDRLFRAHPPVAPQSESEFLHTPPYPLDKGTRGQGDKETEDNTY